MALVRCRIVAVTRPNVILGRNLRHGSGTGTGKQCIIDYGYRSVAERVEPQISKGAANKQLAPPRRNARAATENG